MQGFYFLGKYVGQSVIMQKKVGKLVSLCDPEKSSFTVARAVYLLIYLCVVCPVCSEQTWWTAPPWKFGQSLD